MWLEVEADDGRLDPAEAQALLGRDLWLCYLDDRGNEHVVRGFYLQGSNAQGFYRDHGDGKLLKPCLSG
jgi:hypothetical protein